MEILANSKYLSINNQQKNMFNNIAQKMKGYLLGSLICMAVIMNLWAS